ncbi:hypothetical protein QFZ23_003637 [Arthrobacter globiformis]|uniref:hypothetical protein n=1 Tax=Arthrobacter globiformis TaxID=1665 RepID=UPI00278489A3|nr:hypothetical protein [Arthrobacter globiformis]MDQ1059736.1 hypothetical protein [Arthrobacter globiformis]
MAATVAGLIRGRDVIQDGQALMTVAAAQLDVNMLSFDSVIRVLEDVGFVQGVQRTGGKITSFTENVPYYESLYERLGESWKERQPTDIEQQLLTVVDGLSGAPVPVDDIENKYGLDRSDLKHVMEVAKGGGLIQVLKTRDGDIAYSPFFGFENPEVLSDLVNDHGSGQLSDEFDAVRKHQGLAISKEKYPLISDAIARGLVMAPAVQLPSGTTQAFAALPYVPDKRLLTTHKAILDKALTVLACLRCAEYDGGHNNLSQSALVSVINKLLDKNRGFLSPHSSHERQYNLMYRGGLIVFDPDSRPGGNWKVPRFVDTEDNRAALILARDLITHGEGVETRVSDQDARSALDAGNAYVAPMQMMYRSRESAMQDPMHFSQIFEAAMGRFV